MALLGGKRKFFFDATKVEGQASCMCNKTQSFQGDDAYGTARKSHDHDPLHDVASNGKTLTHLGRQKFNTRVFVVRIIQMPCITGQKHWFIIVIKCD